MLDPTSFLMLWRERADPRLRLAARVDADTTASLLGFSDSDIPILVAAGELKPLGSPANNATKYFWIGEVAEKAADRDWLNKATKIVAKRWKEKRVRQKARRDECEGVGPHPGPTINPATTGR
ncbi:MAG TPA: hypothetical protein PLX06_07660 [Fimbriimonadaceae bacterium]|nr:hypothetical protein [Fimbriimonadaceae bacterium]